MISYWDIYLLLNAEFDTSAKGVLTNHMLANTRGNKTKAKQEHSSTRTEQKSVIFRERGGRVTVMSPFLALPTVSPMCSGPAALPSAMRDSTK